MPHRRTTPKIFYRSRDLRHNQTDAEAQMWFMLRSHRLEGVHFRRQHAIGEYIVDFCAPHRKLIIELDGSQHLDQEGYDLRRDEYLRSKGYRILRFWNDEVMKDSECVLGVILDALEEKE